MRGDCIQLQIHNGYFQHGTPEVQFQNRHARMSSFVAIVMLSARERVAHGFHEIHDIVSLEHGGICHRFGPKVTP